ncbi:MAG: hypothetical protein JXN10_02490 [Clostridia bacterium]|nr:hypothetical protein [Clostridia bacterium]MBN2882367.1 hypothetical protein [Clostridia bacterium]
MKSIEVKFEKSSYRETTFIVDEHIQSLAFPLDSYLEDKLLLGDLNIIYIEGEIKGYFVISDKTIQFFYLRLEVSHMKQDIFEKIVNDYGIGRVFVISQDPCLAAIMVEWDFSRERGACWFVDSMRVIDDGMPNEVMLFRAAGIDDIPVIRQVSGDFFDEPSYNYRNLDERIEAKTVFILEKDREFIGAGLYEKGFICRDCASIGMFTNPLFRKMGAARTILLNLKKHVYSLGLKPVAGCWYYNTLSRKSLESAGMAAASLGYTAVLEKRDRPPKRTGNPPGIPVE